MHQAECIVLSIPIVLLRFLMTLMALSKLLELLQMQQLVSAGIVQHSSN